MTLRDRAIMAKKTASADNRPIMKTVISKLDQPA